MSEPSALNFKNLHGAKVGIVPINRHWPVYEAKSVLFKKV